MLDKERRAGRSTWFPYPVQNTLLQHPDPPHLIQHPDPPHLDAALGAAGLFLFLVLLFNLGGLSPHFTGARKRSVLHSSKSSSKDASVVETAVKTQHARASALQKKEKTRA